MEIDLKELLCSDEDGIISPNDRCPDCCEDWIRHDFHPEIIDGEIYCIANDGSAPKNFRCPKIGNVPPIMQVAKIVKLMKNKRKKR